jgi:hypothetical protein
MKSFIKSTPAAAPKTKESQLAAYIYACILSIIVLCQLFTFDKFLVLLEGFALPGGAAVGHFVAGLIVVSEVFALPFLLGLKLSPLMRVVSMVFGWLVPVLWFKLALWLIFVVHTVHNYGLLGTVTSLVPGWWSVYVSLALLILAVWASWGLWPGKHASAKRSTKTL